jgi:hypothetical protein
MGDTQASSLSRRFRSLALHRPLVSGTAVCAPAAARSDAASATSRVVPPAATALTSALTSALPLALPSALTLELPTALTTVLTILPPPVVSVQDISPGCQQL